MQKQKNYIIKVLILVFIGAFAFLAFKQYIWDKRYIFPETKPFSGNYYYNPYKNIDPAKWLKANFHVHTLAWMGLTNGRKNSNELVDSIYSFLGYGLFSISDYQRINPYLKKNTVYIPVYEHGYLPPKNHQLVLNAKKVCLLDYLFPHTLDNKQNVINTLKKDSLSIVAVAHPHWHDSYIPDDFMYLCGYDLIEVLNHNRFSVEIWDAALSSGRAAFIIADDDSHKLEDINTGGRCCTFINTTIDKDSALAALISGRAYGIDVYMYPGESYSQKRRKFQHLTYLENLTVHGDSLELTLSDTAFEIKFIGQGGQIRKTVKNDIKTSYIFSSDDTYIRTEVVASDKSVLYFNPVIRFNGVNLPEYKASVNYFMTWIWRAGFIILLLSVIFIFRHHKN